MGLFGFVYCATWKSQATIYNVMNLVIRRLALRKRENKVAILFNTDISELTRDTRMLTSRTVDGIIEELRVLQNSRQPNWTLAKKSLGELATELARVGGASCGAEPKSTPANGAPSGLFADQIQDDEFRKNWQRARRGEDPDGAQAMRDYMDSKRQLFDDLGMM